MIGVNKVFGGSFAKSPRMATEHFCLIHHATDFKTFFNQLCTCFPIHIFTIKSGFDPVLRLHLFAISVCQLANKMLFISPFCLRL